MSTDTNASTNTNMTGEQLMQAAMLVLCRTNVVHSAAAAPVRSMTSTAYSGGSGAAGKLTVNYAGRADPVEFEYSGGEGGGEGGAVTYHCLANGYKVTVTPTAAIYSQITQ